MTGVMKYEAREQWIRKKLKFLNRNHVSLDPTDSTTIISDVHPSKLKQLSNWEVSYIDIGESDLWGLQIFEKSTGRKFEFWVRISTQ